MWYGLSSTLGPCLKEKRLKLSIFILQSNTVSTSFWSLYYRHFRFDFNVFSLLSKSWKYTLPLFSKVCCGDRAFCWLSKTWYIVILQYDWFWGNNVSICWGYQMMWYSTKTFVYPAQSIMIVFKKFSNPNW